MLEEKKTKRKKKPSGELVPVSSCSKTRSTRSGTNPAIDSYKAVFDGVSDAVSIVDVETKRYLYANPVLCRMLGYTADEIVGLNVTDTHPRHEWPFLIPGFEAMSSGEVTLATEIPCLTKTGRVVQANISSTRARIDTKPCLIAFFTEVTKFKPKQHILSESEKHLRLILDQSFDGINISEYDVRANKRRLLLCNERFAKMAGRTREQLMTADNVNDFITFHGPEDLLEKCRECILNEEPYRGQASWLRPDGRENYFDWAAAPVKIGDRYYVVGIDRDITECKKAEEELNRAEVRYRTLVEQIPAITYTAAIDETSTTLYISPQVEDILGLTQAQYKKNPDLWAKQLHPDDRDRVLEDLKRAHSTGAPFCCEYRILAANGRIVWIRDEAAIIKNDNGYVFLQGVMFDITEQKNAEQALRRIEETLRKGKEELEQRVKQRTRDLEDLNKRLRAEIRTREQVQTKLLVYQDQLRSLASELALAEERTRRQIATDVHDHIGQNLAMAKMRLQLLTEAAMSPQDTLIVSEVRDIIAKAIESTRTLTFEISPPVLYELGFEAAVEWLLRKARKQQGLKTDFHTDGLEKPLDETVRVFLFQAVRELLVNVAKHAHAKKVAVSVHGLNEHIKVIVADDGVGFLKKKSESQGTNPAGFGLFSIRERLSYIGGKLQIHSVPGKGAEITITAPLAQQQRDLGGKADEHKNNSG